MTTPKDRKLLEEEMRVLQSQLNEDALYLLDKYITMKLQEQAKENKKKIINWIEFLVRNANLEGNIHNHFELLKQDIRLERWNDKEFKQKYQVKQMTNKHFLHQICFICWYNKLFKRK